MGSKSFPSVNEQLVRLLAETSSSFDIAGRYAKHREQHYLRYGEQGEIVNHPEDYRYSSAIDYAGGKGLLDVMIV